jgi:hypothetical protein
MGRNTNRNLRKRRANQKRAKQAANVVKAAKKAGRSKKA